MIYKLPIDKLPLSFTSSLWLTFIFTLGWTVLYLSVRHTVLAKRTADFANRSVSIVHAVVAFVLCLRVLDLSSLRQDIGSTTTPEQVRIKAAAVCFEMPVTRWS